MLTDLSQLGNVENFLEAFSHMLALAMVGRGVQINRIEDFIPSTRKYPKILDSMVGQSQQLKQIAEIVKKVANSRATVLIRGESGTGKELLAKAVHNKSLNRKAPFVSVNCAALSENLLESELFGHEKGAFTGALTSKKGRFELADGGTLFLDEIGYTSIGFQAKILRVLQEGQFERLGGTKTINVDVRIVCATNVNLEEAIEQGEFREDLYYRINVIAMDLPPLRERKDDITPLIQYFLEKYNTDESEQTQILPEDIKMLLNYNWPGNIRELENTIHSAHLMAQDGILSFDKTTLFSQNRPPVSVNTTATRPAVMLQSGNALADEEIEAIENALYKTSGIQKKAADHLGISVRQLRYRIRKYNIIVRKIKR